jgi:hypothetical protein
MDFFDLYTRTGKIPERVSDGRNSSDPLAVFSSLAGLKPCAYISRHNRTFLRNLLDVGFAA